MSLLRQARTLHSLSPSTVALLALFLVFGLQTCGLYIFVKGFLLSRVALSAWTQNIGGANTLPPRYKRAVILVVDALRYDFVFPSDQSSQPYQNVLRLPTQLSAATPENSLLFKFIADPPTTTLQRLKALTVGTLPTFVDAGSNFAGSSIDEDNWLAQAQRAGKRIAFTGDDTWMSLFPPRSVGLNASASLDEDSSWPFDSFNVEDLDTVDDGVRKHLMPLLEDDTSLKWDIVVGHMLGVDHVGHRVGPSHPEMTRKLSELEDLLQRIVKSLRKDDLLVVLGDHGMDAHGNHGGDTAEEVSAALWLYSKTPLTTSKASRRVLDQLKQEIEGLFWSDSFGEHRQIQQISLVPTLSLLLGLPIPFSNLGSIIPEVFAANNLDAALTLNIDQVHTFMNAYLADKATSGERLADRASDLASLFATATSTKATISTKYVYLNAVLEATRASWATFDANSMVAGVSILLLSLAILVSMARLSAYDGVLFRQGALRLRIGNAYAGAISGLVLSAVAAFPIFTGNNLARICLFASSTAASLGYFLPHDASSARIKSSGSPASWFPATATLLALIHGSSFGSNSFVIWEDHMVAYFSQILTLINLAKAWTSPTTRLRNRIAFYSILQMVCVRLMSLSTVCREEQQPHCIATFHVPPQLSAYTTGLLTLLLGVALTLPSCIGAVLDQSQSRQGIAPPFLSIGLRGCLLGAATHSSIDFVLTALDLPPAMQESLVSLKNTAALTTYANIIVGLGLIWQFLSGLNLDIRRTEFVENGINRVKVELIGFANCLGSTYVLAMAGIYALIVIVNRPVGQLSLAAMFVGILSTLEASDSIKDADYAKAQLALTASGKANSISQILATNQPKFKDIVPLALLGHIGFFATGHQAVLSTIQWKAAFVGFSTVVYPLSPILVVLNTLGPFIITAAAVPLTALWNTSPSIKDSPSVPLIRHSFRACILFILYHSLIAIPTAIFAAWHRRHLMVWKVFAPRFMTAAITLFAVDAIICIISFGWLTLAVLRTSKRQLGSHWS